MRGLVALLVASVAVNAYLIATRESRLRVEAVAPVAPTETVDQSAKPTVQARAVLAGSASYGSLERKVLEQRVLAAEAQVEEFMDPEEKYAKQERSIESEARAKPYLDLIFKDIPGTEPKYRVECHGRVCKIDAKQDNAWIGPLQSTYPGRTMFGTMSFSDKTFVELLTEGAALATRIHYEASEAIHACAIANPEPGDVSYQLTMDNAHRVTAQINGSLAKQPVGKCIATALQGAITKTPVPPNTQIEDRERTLTLPLEE
jgi:hypothetical protein